MVSLAIDEGLIDRIRRYVANDINGKIVMDGSDKELEVKPRDVHILSFERVFNNWMAIVTAEHDIASFYKIAHDGYTDQTVVTIYLLHSTNEAII